MNDNRGKIYEFLINSGRVTEQQIGDSAKFVNTINTADKAKKLHDFLVGGKIFTEEELGDSDKFVGAFKFEDTQAKGASYMQEVSGEMPETPVVDQSEMQQPSIDQAPEYSIGDKSYSDKDEFLDAVSKISQKDNSVKVKVSNDDVVDNEVKRMMLRDDYYDRKIQDGDPSYSVSVYADAKSGRDLYSNVSQAISSVDQNPKVKAVVAKYKDKYEREASSIVDGIGEPPVFDMPKPKTKEDTDKYNQYVSDFNAKVRAYNLKAEEAKKKIDLLGSQYQNEFNAELKSSMDGIVKDVSSNTFIDEVESEEIKSMVAQMPKGYQEQKIFIKNLIDNSTSGYTGDNKRKAREEAIAEIRKSVLYDSSGNLTVYAMKNQAENEMVKLKDRLSTLEREVASEVSEAWKGKQRGIVAPQYGMTGSDFTPSETKKKQVEINRIKTAISNYEQALKVPDTGAARSFGEGWKQFWMNFDQDAGANIITGGWYGAAQALDIMRAVKSGEEATEGDKALLNSYMIRNAISGDLASSTSMAYTVGKGLAGSLPFVVSIMTTAGLSGALGTLTKKTLGWQLTRGIKDRAINAFSKALSAGVVATPLSGAMWEKAAQKSVDIKSKFTGAKVEADADMKVRSAVGTIAKAWIATYPDFVTESFGGSIQRHITSPVLKRLGLGALTKVGSSKISSAINTVAKKGMINDLPTEFIEEQLAGIANIATGEEQASDFYTARNQISILLTCAAMTTPISAVNVIAGGKAKEGVKQYLNDAKIKELDAIISGVEDIDIKSSALTKFAYDNNLSDEAIVEVGKYAWVGQQEQTTKIASETQTDTEVPSEVESGEITTPEEQETPVVDDIEAEKADIERRRQEELKNRVVYDRFPTVEDGEFKIIGDPNNKIYRINENTGRPQELDESNGLWSNTAMSPTLFNESTKRSGFEKSKNKINAKYDAELAALNGKEVSPESAAERVAGEPKSVEEVKPLKTEQDAIQEQATDEGVLRPEEPEVGLQKMVERDQERKEPAKEGEKAEIETPEGFRNRVHEGGTNLGKPNEKSHITEKGYIYRSVGLGEIASILRLKGVFPKEGKQRGGNKNTKYWSRGDGKFFYVPSQLVIRLRSENMTEDKVVKASDLEIWDIENNIFVPFNDFAPTLQKPEAEVTEKPTEAEIIEPVKPEAEIAKEEPKFVESTGIKPKNLRDVYKAGREVFGLSKVQALAQAIVVDKMVARMAKNKGVSKGKVYEAMTFKKSTIGELSGGAQRLYQSVWHGSPHSFEKFMLDKIGTGEGAQAYGWGLYFTDKESIARAYANMGSQSVMLGDRRLLDVDELEDMLADDEEFAYYTSKKRVIEHAKEVAKTSEEAVKNAESSIDNIKENVRKELERNEREISTLEGELAEERRILDHIIEHKTALGEGASRVISGQEMRAENLKMQIDAKKKITEEKIRNVLMDRYLHELYYQNGILKSANYLLDNIDNLKEISNRNLYKVKLHGDRSIDEFNYLRWDKKLGTKTAILINELLNKEGIDLRKKNNYIADISDNTGSVFYGALSNTLGSDKEASLFLLRAGIDGIKYPTEITRKGTHEESFNYVIFDENVAEIEEHIKFQRGQGAQAAVSFLSDGSAIVHALTNPNVSSPLHEVAHIYERYMTANEKATVLRWTGDKSWTIDTSEKFARGFERYLADGVAPTEALRRIFERFKEWMTEIYNGITGSEIDIELNDDMRALYGQMLGGKGVRPSTPKAAKTEAELLKEADDLFNQVLFQVIGEKGAAALDKAEEATTRLDNLSVARDMEQSGKDAKATKLATGWERGVDGKWRYEVPDVTRRENIDERIKNAEKLNKGNTVDLVDFVTDNNGLFKSYPQLRWIKIVFDKNTSYVGSYNKLKGDGGFGQITINPLLHKNDTDLFSTLLHEVQHAIQDIEGFAQGGNSSEWKYLLEKEMAKNNRDFWDGIIDYKEKYKRDVSAQKKFNPIKNFENYKRLSGEVESRNVQTRMTLTPEERLSTLLSETEDVAREDQIILMDGLGGSQIANSESITTENGGEADGMPLFQAPTDALTKALNRLIDAAEKAVGKNSAKVTEYVNKYITEKNLPIDKAIVDAVLSQRGYAPKPRKARSAEAIEKSIWGLRVEELEPDEKLRAKLIEDKFSSYVPEKWETVQRISDAMYQEMGDTAEDRVENVLSKIKDINIARDYKMTIIANAFNEVNGLIENSTDPEAWRDVKEALYEMMLAHSISMGRSFNYMKNLNRMVFGDNFFERMANKKHSQRVEKFVEKHKERVGKKFKAESAKLYDEAARENIQSEEVQKAIKKVAEKNGYRSATKEKLAEIRKKKEDLIARHKAAIAQRRGQLSASVLPMGITPEDVEFIGEYVSLLLQEGVYKTKALTDRIRWYVKDAMGVDITEEEARDLLPEDVDGVNFDEWQEGKKKEASAEVLAGRIVGMVKEKKADNDPVKMMIDILTAKARERIPAAKRAKMTPLEVLVQAIRNRKEYQKTWEDAKAVVEKRIAAMKVSDEAKADMMSKVEEAYKTATELPFSDAVVTKAVRQTLEELEYVLNKIVLSTATEKAVVKDELKKRIVEQTGLEDEDAEVLAKAIEQAFNAALDSKAQRTVENMIYRLDRQKDVSATKIVEYLNNKGSKMGKDNPYSFLINNLREQAIAKLREIDAENKKTKGVEKYGEAMLKGMSTGRALSLAFIDDIELKDAIEKAQQAVMDKVNDGTYLRGLNEEMRNVIIADLSHFDSRAQTAILKTEEAIIRSRAANELIQFVRIGAFDNGDFAKAYAMAKGMTPPTKAQIDHIKSMYNRMAKEQSEMIKKELEAELLAYMANMGGVDLADILTATLAFSMLGNVAVQIKNTGLAAGAMMIDFLREASRRAITMDKRGLDELVKAYTRNRGLNMAINTFKTGVSHLPQKFDIPDVLYRAKRDVKDSRGDKLIKRALAVYSFTMNWMNASDSFFVFTNAEARIALMTLDKGREELRRNIGVNQKAFLDQFISENLYSVEMREQAEAQVAEDEAELVKQGIDPYTARQRKLAVYDKIDQLRDPELRGEAFDLATRLFGNTDFYGVLGMMMDGFIHYIRTIPVIGNTPLLAPLVFFTRIATNIATYLLNMTPVGWVRLYTGKYGATLNGKNQRYVREISASERKAIMQYQVMGLIIGTAAVSIFLGGDDDDPWFAVCGTGINAAVNGFPYGYKGEKWKKNTIKLGDTYLGYDGTVMQPMFALIGEAMDGYRFNRDKDGKREKDLNKFFMDLAVYFAVSPVSIVNSNYLSLIESVGTTLYGAAEKVINREETIASISGVLAMDIPLNNYLNMMYLGDVYEVVKMAMEIPDNDGDKLFDTMAKRTYLEMILNDDRMYRTDVFGDAVIKNPTYFTRGIAEYKGMSEWAEYNAKYYKAIPEARVSDPEFFIEKKGVTEKRSLNAYDKNEAYAFWRYQNIRGRYIKERIMMLKADNVTGDAYREEIKKAIAQAGAFARSETQAFINEGGLYSK